eukprot:768278-Hanusia_phi.AAC.4
MRKTTISNFTECLIQGCDRHVQERPQDRGSGNGSVSLSCLYLPPSHHGALDLASKARCVHVDAEARTDLQASAARTSESALLDQQQLSCLQVFGCFMACMVIGSSLVKDITRLRGPPVVAKSARGCSSLTRCRSTCAKSSSWLPCAWGCRRWRGSTRTLRSCASSFSRLPASRVLAPLRPCQLICGVYWPSMATIKSKYVPEEV